jgi:hypothetical protein
MTYIVGYQNTLIGYDLEEAREVAQKRADEYDRPVVIWRVERVEVLAPAEGEKEVA